MKKKPVLPWEPAKYDAPGVTGAIKALNAGNANEGQQKLALMWILNDVCGIRDLSFRPGVDGERDTAFAEGKRFVGLQIAKQFNLPTSERRGG